MPNELALVTGASSGIGLELARELARNGHPLIISAPVEAELLTVAEELTRTFGVQVSVIAADLEQEESAARLCEAVKSSGKSVEILVNNAGLGQKGNFWEIPIEKDIEMVRVNIEAVLRLTKLFLPAMLDKGRGRILNTASIAGFMPAPTVGVYHATKAFVLSFSEALATELQDKGITVTALCPGATDTDFFPKADLTEATIFQKGNVMSPQEVAAAGYEAVMKGERVHVPGGINKAMVFSRRLMPESALAKIMETSYAM